MPSLRARLRDAKLQAKSLLRPLFLAAGQPPAFDPEIWGLAAVPGGGLALGSVALHPLLERFGSPLFVVDAKQVRANAAAFQSVPSGHATGCEVFYSYKTNPVEGVLRLLHAEGVGAEVISHYELWLANRLGLPPSRIIYNGPGKSDESIRLAVELGIELINCNHREEIARVAEVARALGRRVRVGLRVDTEEGWSAQFGTPVRGGHALAAFREAQATGVLDVVGLHAHRGGMIRSESELTRFAGAVLSFADEVEQTFGCRLEVLNFGGSLGLSTVAGLDARDRKLNQALYRDMPLPVRDGVPSIARYVQVLLDEVEQHYRRVGRSRPRVFVEPGRAMTANTQMLLASVMTTKDAGDLKFVVLDAGINLAESVRGEYHQLFALNRFGEPARCVHTLVGPICSPGDTLYAAARLPELFPRDSVAIMDAGAYFVPFSTSFSFPRPAIVMVDGDRVETLRRRETFDDLVSRDTGFGAEVATQPVPPNAS